MLKRQEQNDIALVRLDRDAHFLPNFIMPICLPTQDDNSDQPKSDEVDLDIYTAGWGYKSSGCITWIAFIPVQAGGPSISRSPPRKNPALGGGPERCEELRILPHSYKLCTCLWPHFTCSLPVVHTLLCILECTKHKKNWQNMRPKNILQNGAH